MLNDVNKVMVTGRIGKEIKVINPIFAKLDLAIKESWKDKNSNEWKNKTYWVSVALVQNKVKLIQAMQLKTGDFIYIEGKITTNTTKKEDGTTNYFFDIEVNDFNGDIKIIARKNTNSEEYTISDYLEGK